MSILTFNANETPTIGVEIELQLVDAKTFELRNAIEPILEKLPEDLKGHVKPELMQSYLEINTGICRNVSEVGLDLGTKIKRLQPILDELGIRLFWGATHPFSSWRDQKVTVDDRYHRLVDLMQDVARRLVTFGLHVHVGLDSGDKAIMVCDRMMRHLPLLLALSANSPFWETRATGLHSNRSKIMEGLPTAGLPNRMRNWSEFAWLVNHLSDTGFIHSVREIWWDIRPHHNFGTVEVRVCDMPCSLDQVLSITALIQCLVQDISQEIDEGTYQFDEHPMMVAQNKWRATRFGPQARLVSSEDYQQYTVQSSVDRLVSKLAATAETLGCSQELAAAGKLPTSTGSLQQLKLWEETNDPRSVVRRMIENNTSCS